MGGVKAALEGRKMDANNYPESDDLHFEWLAGWASVQLDYIRSLMKAKDDPAVVPYDPDKIEHQEPVCAVSEWQQGNDADGAESIAHEIDMEDS